MTLLTSTELAEALGVKQYSLRKWVRCGLPRHKAIRGPGYGYDADEVADFLLENSLAVEEEEPEPVVMIARTVEEVASYFGVVRRTVHTWLLEQDFPGRSGTPGQRDGYFPLLEISEWLKHKGWGHGDPDHDASEPAPPNNARDRLMALRGDRVEIDIRKELNELLDAEKFTRFNETVSSYTIAVLEQAPGEALSLLPADYGEDVRRAVRVAMENAIAQAIEVIQELISGDVDDQELSEDDGDDDQRPADAAPDRPDEATQEANGGGLEAADEDTAK